MTNQYGNLGLIYEILVDLEKAKDYLHKAKELYTEIGIKHMADEMQEWIDSLGK